MAFKIGYANGYKDLLIALKGFLTSAKKAYNIAAGENTGDGYVSAERASTAPVDETWTLTATSASNFTVTGSVSGAQAAATVGTPYDNGIVAFTIIAGDTAFVATDSFTFDVADGLGATEKYTVKRWDTDYDGAGEYELILMGPGTAGTDEIYTAIQTIKSAGDDYYNWRLCGMTAYSDVELQYMPGRTQGRLPRLLMWQEKIKYWLAANGRHYRLVAKISNVYEPLYMGFDLAFGLPTQFPYNMVVGGAACPYGPDATYPTHQRYSSTENSHRSFPNPFAGGAGVVTNLVFDNYSAGQDLSTLKVLQGTSWVGIYGKSGSDHGNIQKVNIVWPYASSYYKSYGYTYFDIFSGKLRENLDGSYPAFPAIPMISNPNRNIRGPLQGIVAVPAFGGVAAEDIFTEAGKTYIAFPIVPNAGRSDYFGFLLE